MSEELGMDLKANVAILEKNKSENQTVLDFLKAIEEKNFENAFQKISIRINGFKDVLSKKPQCKLSRQGLAQCWDFIKETYHIDEGIQFQTNGNLPPKTAKKPIQSIKAFVMDHLLENEWKKQCEGKFGGPKPPFVSWKEFYFSLEAESDVLKSSEDKVRWAVDGGHLNYFNFLLDQDKKLDVKSICYKNGQCLTSRSISKNYKKMALNFLDRKFKSNCIDENGWSPIHYSVFAGNKTIIKRLIKEKSTINQKDKKGLTPVHIATIKNYNDILKFLLGQGAKVNIKDKNGRLPLHYALMNNDLQASEWLIEYGADINAKDSFGRTYLHWAASCNNTPSIKLLLLNKCNINIKDKFGRTAMHYAAQHGNVSAIELLLKDGAAMNIKDNFEDTPLLVAAFYEHGQEMVLLHEAGAR